MASTAPQRAERRLASIEEAQRAMPRLIAELNAQPNLARAALANPIFAIEELGWSIDERVRTTFERRIRFRPEVAVRLDALEAQIAEIAGRHVEVDDPHEVARLLFDQLHLDVSSPRPRKTKRAAADESAGSRDTLSTAPLPPRLPWSPPTGPDPLAVLEGRHPVIAPLLEFRLLDAGAPRLATPEAYREVRDAGGGSIGNVRFSRHRAAEQPAKTPKKPPTRRSKKPSSSDG